MSKAPRFYLDGQVTPLERKLREFFEAHPSEPLTVKQLAARIGRAQGTVQGALSLLHDEGFVKRRRSFQAMRPWEYILGTATWPSNTAARIAYQAARDASYRGQVRSAIAATAPGQGACS